MIKNKIKEIINELDEIGKKYGYNNFEIALLIYLRGDIEIVNKLTNEDITYIKGIIDCVDSVLDIEKCEIDEILDKYLKEED